MAVAKDRSIYNIFMVGAIFAIVGFVVIKWFIKTIKPKVGQHGHAHECVFDIACKSDMAKNRIKRPQE